MAEPPRLPPAPLLRRPARAGSLMARVALALAPALALGVAAYGLPALLVVLACAAGALAGEAAGALLLGRRPHPADGSALLSGLLLALTLPPALAPGWAFAGALAGVLLARQLFGGLGHSLVNPALLGRLLLSLAAPGALEGALLEPFGWQQAGWWSLPQAAAADPLRGLWQASASLRQALQEAAAGLAGGAGQLDRIQALQDQLAALGPGQLLWPRLPGLLGEASILALLPGLLWLFAARLVDWRIPAAGLLVLPFALLLAAGDPAGRWLPLALSLKGSSLLLLCCVFASDPVTSPLGHLARFCFGVLVATGATLALRFSDQAGALFWVLPAANMATPWLDRLLLPGGPR